MDGTNWNFIWWPGVRFFPCKGPCRRDLQKSDLHLLQQELETSHMCGMENEDPDSFLGLVIVRQEFLREVGSNSVPESPKSSVIPQDPHSRALENPTFVHSPRINPHGIITVPINHHQLFFCSPAPRQLNGRGWTSGAAIANIQTKSKQTQWGVCSGTPETLSGLLGVF